MTDSFNAFVINKNDDESSKRKTAGAIASLSLTDLPDEKVLVAVEYSSLNYKDGLVVTGKGRVCRSLPMVAGIDLAGTVVESTDARYQAGDKVLVNGYGLSESHWGGYSQMQRVNPDFLVKLDTRFSSEQAMAIGTAGYTAMLCVMAIQDHGVKPEDGAVLVTGAAGGVGSMAVMLLAKLGYSVTASTGRVESTQDFLTSLGASDVIDRAVFDVESKPLAAEQWMAVVDSVGAQPLASVLAQVKYEGIVAACGLAAGMGLPTTVAPFILRGVTLRGIDSVMASQLRRARAWKAMAELVDIELLASLYEVRPMSELPALGEQILAGQVKGRVVIDVNR
ncbi:MAG TPA: oxidoreductase [Cellvibrionales bacterium]|nr:oxidoreductase [Cellvibrionales bacterium]